MEIYTQNLLTVSVAHDRIQHNFAAIDAAIKNINQRLSELDLSQKDLKHQLQGNAKHLHTIKSIVNSQAETLKRHSMLIDEMQADDEPSSPKIAEDDDLKVEIERKVESENQRTNKEGQSNDKATITIKEKDSMSSRFQEIQPIKKPTIEDIKPKTGKNSLQKTYLNLKERIIALERDSDYKQTIITELKIIVDKYKQRELEHHPRKVSLELVKKSTSKKQIPENKSRSSIQAHSEMKQDSSKSIMNPLSEVLDHPEISQPSNVNIASDSNDLLSKQIGSLKESLLQKIRVIEAQYKQSQHRAQNIEKTVDILQRSHQMLKYDFDRTSTSWSKNRSNPTQERFRSHERLKDTPMTVHEFYEEKMLELFNQMDQIKKEYFEIQNKLAKEDDTPVQWNSNLQKNPNDPKEKPNHSKIVHSLKVDGGEQKKQIALLRKQLSKLREDFDQFAWGVNTNSGNEVKTVVIKPNENKQDWKILSTKMYKLKMQLQSGLRELQNKIATNNDMVVVLNGLEVGIEECRLLMKRKVEHSDYQKGLKRLESRLNNFILQVYEKENKQMEADASLVRQPWFCLSCDNEVKSYGNKGQKSPPKEKLMGRKVNPESHMVRRNQNGKLPSVIK